MVGSDGAGQDSRSSEAIAHEEWGTANVRGSSQRSTSTVVSSKLSSGREGRRCPGDIASCPLSLEITRGMSVVTPSDGGPAKTPSWGPIVPTNQSVNT